MSDQQPKNGKMRSRTFWLTIVWTLFVPLSIIAQVIVPEILLPIGTICTFAGTVTTFYIGGDKGAKIATAAGKPAGQS